MTGIEILSLVVTIVCLLSFCVVFTILFRHYYLTAIDSVASGERDIELIDNAVIEELESRSKKKKALRLAAKIASWTLLGIVLVAFGFSLYARLSENQMAFGDTSWIVIASGSMSEKNSANQYLVENDLNNQFDTYDIIRIAKYSSVEEVRQYDVVAFKSKDGTTIVHRIVTISEDMEGPTYLTRGDSNSADDSGAFYDGLLHYDDLIGHYTGDRIQALGALPIFLQSNAGIITVVAIAYCLLMFDHYKGKFDGAVVDRTNVLIEVLDFDAAAPKEDQPVDMTYRERLIYKGHEYTFEDGAFVSKEEIKDEALSKASETSIIHERSEGEEGTIEILSPGEEGKESYAYHGEGSLKEAVEEHGRKDAPPPKEETTDIAAEKGE